MTDKEFKRLGKAQLMDIIYQLQSQVDELSKQNQLLEKSLADKRLRVNNAGNLAEAALEINDCFRSAQRAADQYLQEIKEIRDETEAERIRILATARAEAAVIISEAKRVRNDYDDAIKAILKECEQDGSGNG